MFPEKIPRVKLLCESDSRVLGGDDELPSPASHVDVADPQVVDGGAVLGEEGGHVAPLEELHGRDGLGVPDIRAEHLVSFKQACRIQVCMCD